jgi:hypothetical protein
MEIVGYIQLATHKPAVGDSEFGKMAIAVARELQNSLDPNSECFKLLEFNWELQARVREIDSCEQQADAKVQVQELKDTISRVFGINTDKEMKPDE